MFRLLITLTLISFFYSLEIKGQNNNQKVLDFLKKEMRENSIPGLQLAVIKNDEIVFSESLGLANVPFAVKAKKNTIFSINSIAKIFTATAIMQLVENKKLEIEYPISKYLDGLPKSWQEVTVLQLLSNTSGLPDIEGTSSGDLIGKKGIDTAWILLQKMPMEFKAGDQFSYNATNYLLLEKIIEKLSGVDFEKFIKQKQFKVVGMEKTSYSNSFEVVKDKCPTYSFYSFDKEVDDYVLRDYLVEVTEEFPIKADAGIFSTAEEVAKWIIALQTGKLLSKESIDKMWKPVKLNNGKYGGFGGLLNAYAFGWPVINRKNHRGVSAFGGGRAALTIYPEDNCQLYYLQIYQACLLMKLLTIFLNFI